MGPLMATWGTPTCFSRGRSDGRSEEIPQAKQGFATGLSGPSVETGDDRSILERYDSDQYLSPKVPER